MTLPHLSTSTPASEISSADFARMEAEAARNDTVGNSDETAVPSMADILRNSPAAKFWTKEKDDDESPPKSAKEEVAPVETEEEVDVPKETSEDTVTDSDEEKDQETTDEEGTDEDDQGSTQDAELPSEEDIDWEYKVPVKIDGKVEYKTLEEIRKGFATDQHLSQKGRELGELKKKIETEGAQKLDEIVKLGTVMHEELSAVEEQFAHQYKVITAKIKEARESGDTYTARELKEKQEEVQDKYWEARNKREARTKEVITRIQAKQAEEQQTLLDSFHATIKTHVPEFDEKVATSIRSFALKEGIPEEVLNNIYDPRIVKVLNDYRKLKTAKETGVVKRKATPVVKSIPSKKAPSQATKEKRNEDVLRSKVLSGAGSKDDQNDFLKSISKIRHKL